MVITISYIYISIMKSLQHRLGERRFYLLHLYVQQSDEILVDIKQLVLYIHI